MILLIFLLVDSLMLFLVTLKIGLFWTTSFIFVYYTLNYIRGSHLSGVDTFDLLRSLPFWKMLHRVKLRITDLERINDDTRYVVLLYPNYTNNALIWAFGLHGDRKMNRLRLCYLMPWIMFYVPLLREILLLSGAVSAEGNVEDRVIEMIRKGRNVVYCPTGMEDVLYVHEGNEIRPKKPTMNFYTKAAENGYEILPTLCLGETDGKYFFVTSEYVRIAQEWILKKIGHPALLLYFFANSKKDIDVTVGESVTCHKRTPHDIQEDVNKTLVHVNTTVYDKKLSFAK